MTKFNRSAFIKEEKRICDNGINIFKNNATVREEYAQGTNEYDLNEKNSVRSMAPFQDLGIYSNDYFVCQYDPSTGKGGFRYYSDVPQVID